MGEILGGMVCIVIAIGIIIFAGIGISEVVSYQSENRFLKVCQEQGYYHVGNERVICFVEKKRATP